MSKTFQIKFEGDAKVLIDRAKKIARDNGAYFNGDETKGSFSGSGVAGNYLVEQDTIIITIDKKPFIAPWHLVENKIRDFFS